MVWLCGRDDDHTRLFAPGRQDSSDEGYPKHFSRHVSSFHHGGFFLAGLRGSSSCPSHDSGQRGNAGPLCRSSDREMAMEVKGTNDFERIFVLTETLSGREELSGMSLFSGEKITG